MKKLVLKIKSFVDGSEMIDGKPVVVKSLNSWLLTKPLHGKELRLRNRFIRATKDLGEEIEDSRKDLILQFAKKGADGKPEMMTTPQGDQFVIDDQESFNKGWKEYINETTTIRLTPELQESVEFIKNTIEKAIEKENFVGRQSIIIEEWLDAFNAIEEMTADEEDKVSESEEVGE